MGTNVVTFGEIMLRLAPPGYRRLRQAGSFEATYAGAEANVAVSLAILGHPSFFVTRVPDHEIGQAAVDALRKYGVHDEYVARGGDRLGVYFLETGAGQRASKVIYDRAHSSFATLAPDEFAWDRILDGCTWFHFTGITAALGDGPRRALHGALAAARDKGATVSADLNYRAQLWSVEQAADVMTPLMPYVNVLIANEEHARTIFRAGAGASASSPEGCRELGTALRARFGCRRVVITVRRSLSAFDTTFSAHSVGDGGFCSSKTHAIHMVDRLGSGDAFAAGLIHATLAGRSEADALEFGSAAACLNHSLPGDFNLVTAEEIDRLASGDDAGNVRR